ncbi:epididymal secretory protein 4-like isoform X1 [Pantherophis guttatus]|uniref:Epididymal secretory protein 4-like isoform X1 n=1 Tax=Pantherophis guttatus TaxID=94885 RepID=A0A6P9D8V3_PANGU|nr:epididymal secretory protein 4-like isoform X1 [Pantherophis guttatus]
MKLLLGSLLLAGVCWLGAAMDFTTMSNFKSKKMSGEWHPVANIVIEKQFPQYTLKAMPKGGLSYSYRYLANGKCKTRRFRFAEQGQAGKYKITSQATTQILDTDYESYIISYIERGMDAFLTLASKEKTMSSDLETKFKEFASTAGVTGEVVPLISTETC